MELGVTIKESATNPVIGDLMLTTTGDEVVLTELRLEVSQRLFIALQFFKSEWFLDENEGLPYFERILVKAPEDRVIRSVFAQVIEGTEGVERLQSFSYTIDRERKMRIQFSCILADGTLFRSTDYAQFIVADV